jgi:hypothetical protein
MSLFKHVPQIRESESGDGRTHVEKRSGGCGEEHGQERNNTGGAAQAIPPK